MQENVIDMASNSFMILLADFVSAITLIKNK
jgi:hypothetical protein